MCPYHGIGFDSLPIETDERRVQEWHDSGPLQSQDVPDVPDAMMQGIKVIDYAEEHEELKTAFGKWVTDMATFQTWEKELDQ